MALANHRMSDSRPSPNVSLERWLDTARLSWAFRLMDLAHQGPRSGTFSLGSKELRGELTISGPNTNLHVYSDAFFGGHNSSSQTIHGILRDLTRVTLLQCNIPPIPGRTSQFRVGQTETQYSADIFPHYVLTGDDHLSDNTPEIVCLSVGIDDAPIIFYDHDAFGISLDPEHFIAGLVERNGSEIGRTPIIGKAPQIAFFTGRFTIFSTRTPFGTISAKHHPHGNLGGPEGVFIKNRISIDLEFEVPVTFDVAMEALTPVLWFLQIMAGRVQNIDQLAVRLIDEGEAPRWLQVHWSLKPDRRRNSERKPHPFDLPLVAAQEPEVFGDVLSRWLVRDSTWREARARFVEGFAKGNAYDVGRLIAAANLFDLLPDDAVPATVVLSEDILTVKKEVKARFKTLPKTPERESVLNALGRVGRPTLRHRISHRAAPILAAFPDRFPHFDRVIDLAIDCRNRYVHGGPSKIDYTAHFFATIPFLIDSLEFVFAVSDLLDAGWDPAPWRARGTVMSHPLASYSATYRERLVALLTLADAVSEGDGRD